VCHSARSAAVYVELSAALAALKPCNNAEMRGAVASSKQRADAEDVVRHSAQAGKIV